MMVEGSIYFKKLSCWLFLPPASTSERIIMVDVPDTTEPSVLHFQVPADTSISLQRCS